MHDFYAFGLIQYPRIVLQAHQRNFLLSSGLPIMRFRATIVQIVAFAVLAEKKEEEKRRKKGSKKIVIR